MSIPAIVLAGGRSSRMGRPKALLRFGPNGDTFFDRVTRTLLDAGASEVVVVVGADADAIIAAATPGAGVRIVPNPDYAQGQLTSLVAGLRAIDADRPEAAIVTLIDVPLVTADTVRTLLAARQETRALIVRPERGRDHGHPVIFDAKLFPELIAADPAFGAKPVVRAHAADILGVSVNDDGAFIDIDTPADFERHVERPIRPTARS